MKTINLSKQEAIEIIEDNTKVSTGTWKWGSVESYVFEKNNNHYMLKLYIHGSEGWQLEDSVIARQVKPITKTVTEWVDDND